MRSARLGVFGPLVLSTLWVTSAAALPLRGAPAPKAPKVSTSATVVLRAGWGSGPSQLGRHLEEQGNPECPKTLLADESGTVTVLDQVNHRLVRFGTTPRAIPLPAETIDDVVPDGEGGWAVLDRLVTGSLAFLDKDGRLDHEVPVTGSGVAEGGGVTALFRDEEGFWVEYEFRQQVRVATPDRKADPKRPTRPGRRTQDGQAFLRARLEGDDTVFLSTVPARAPDRAPTLFTRVRFPLPATLLALEPAKRGEVWVAAHLFEEAPPPDYGVLHEKLQVVLLGSEGGELKRVEVPAPRTADEQFRPWRLGADGNLYQLACEPQGAVVRRIAR